MMIRRKARSVSARLATTFLLAALAPLCTSCGDGGLFGPETLVEPVAGGSIVIGTIRDLDSWNPYLCETVLASEVLALIYPSLVIEQPDYRDHPPSFASALATHWGWSEDKLTLTMHLRDNAVWSDGVPVTAEDVLFTWKVQRSPEIGWTGSYIKDFIESVDAPDPRTVRFRFSRRYPYQVMDINDGLILPAHAWSEIPFARWRETDWSEKVVSAGPYRLERHVPQQELVLERNPGYWKEGRPLIDRVIWRIVPDQASLLTQLKTGAIDFMRTVPPADAERVASDPDLRLVVYPDRRYTYIGWNNRHPLFSDARVRKALTLAIDREAILDSAAGGYGNLAIGPILTRMWAFNKKLEPLPYEPEKALELLSQAGWSDSDGDGTLDRDGKPFRFELLTNTEVQERRDICLLVQQQLKRIGIEVEPLFLDIGTVISRLEESSYDAHVSSWQEPTQIDLEDLWHSPPDNGGSYNWIGYSNPEVDRLIGEVAREAGFIEQKVIFELIQTMIVEDQPYTFLYESEARTGISRRLQGATINATSPYFDLESWWVSGPPSGRR